MRPRPRVLLLTAAVVLLPALAPLSIAATAAAHPTFTTPSRADDPKISTGLYPQEPATIVGADGTRYVANQLGSQLSYTRDGGATWQHPGGKDALSKNVSGCTPATDIGDVDLAADRTGRVYFTDLQGTVGGTADNGIQPIMATSDDHFKTYTGTCVAHQPFLVDREWTDAYTPPGKSSSDTRVYISYHDFGPDAMWVNTSKDGGKTWGLPVDVLTDVASATGGFCDTIPGGTSVDQRNGWVYVAWAAGPNAVNNLATGCNETQDTVFNNYWVAVSKDEGATWTATKVFTGPDNTSAAPDDMSEIFGTVSVGRSGDVYAGWIGFQNGAYGAYIDHSPPADGSGALHFTPPVKISAPTVGTAFYVRMVAGSRGRVDVIYLGTDVHDVPVTPANVQANMGGAGKLDCQPALRDPGLKGVRALGKPCEMPASTRWRLHLVQILDADSAHPHPDDQVLRPDSVHPGDLCTLGINCLPDDNRDITDVNDVRIDASGGFQVAYTAENDARTHNEVDFQCQTGGPGLYAGVAVRSCRAAPQGASPVVPVKGPPPVAAPRPRSLAATGAGRLLPGLGLMALLLGVAVRRRRSA
ncbi:MAG: hypothetical protein JWO88_1169 [Frankiales bacterium]|nr:hypothetical protein [Frankiales bacterium]